MLNPINKLLMSIISIIPESLVYKIAKQYVAGINQSQAIQTVKSLNDQGYLATLDILGEHTKNKEDAKLITDEYVHIYKSIKELNLMCNISVKPTHIGADIDEHTLNENLSRLLETAERFDNFLRIDMESSKYTDLTINIIQKHSASSNSIGTVLQAYLHRTISDLSKIKSKKSSIRLCKGIYNEPEDIAIKRYEEINDNYIKILKEAFKSKIFVGIATHDINLLSRVYKLIEDNNISSDMFEFQVLYGVPMSGWLKKHKENGYSVRVYVPFGDDWYKYSIRRLKENPNIVGYILKNLIKKK